MNSEEENFAVDLTDKAGTHVQWLALVRFGLGTLVENQPVLAEVLVREACREYERYKEEMNGGGSKVPADFITGILSELQLQILPAHRGA